MQRPPSASVSARTRGASKDTAPATYADGRGGLALESVFQARGADCRLEYSGTFRAGTITYVERVPASGLELRIDFWHEMGGGNCRFYIHLPSVAEWPTATGTPVTRRDDIVDFIAETVRREEAGSWRYEIDADQITYY